ncbi:MAG: hypothetical protein V3T72_22430, partial [Thermoanaerobaculia bacterium]
MDDEIQGVNELRLGDFLAEIHPQFPRLAGQAAAWNQSQEQLGTPSSLFGLLAFEQAMGRPAQELEQVLRILFFDHSQQLFGFFPLASFEQAQH